MSRTDKRGNGQGTLYRRSGRRGWFGAVTVESRRKVVHAETKTEAARLLAQAITLREAGRLVVAPNQTAGACLHQWLEQVVKPRVRPGTYRGYEQLVRIHLVPALGKTRLDRLAPAQVQALLDAKLEAGLAPATVRYIRAVLRSALKHAVRWGLTSVNAAELVDGPRVEREEIKPFTPAQARQLLDAARGDRLEALYAVALAMGLRQGEALGLRWEDVDLDDGLIHVRRQLLRTKAGLAVAPVKTARGRRTLSMPATIADTLGPTASANWPQASRRLALSSRRPAENRWTPATSLGLSKPCCRKQASPTAASTTSGIPRRPCCWSRACRLASSWTSSVISDPGDARDLQPRVARVASRRRRADGRDSQKGTGATVIRAPASRSKSMCLGSPV